MLPSLSAILACATLIQLTTTVAPPEKDMQVEPAFKGVKIVPNIIDTAPNVYLSVIFPPDVFVDLGTILGTFATLNKPAITWRADRSKYYTLIYLGPDLLDNELCIGFVFWQVVNIPGDDVAQGTTIAAYFNPPNVAGTAGLTLQLFLVYQQAAKMDTTISMVTGEVGFINVKDYAAKNKLTIYAGNFATTNYV